MIHLHVRSCYSLLESSLTIPDLIRLAQEHDQKAVVLTDHLLENIFAICMFIKTIIMNKNDKTTIGPITTLRIKFDIRKYGLNVFRLYKIIGNIVICTEIETDIISFILSRFF